MDIKTNEENVAIWRIAWELCENIVFSVKEDWDEEGELVTLQPPEPNTEEWVSRKAELIRQTYNKLQQEFWSTNGKIGYPANSQDPSYRCVLGAY